MLIIQVVCNADFETKVSSGYREVFTIEDIQKIREDEENGNTN